MTQTPFVKSLNIAIITALVQFIDKYPILKETLNKSKNPSKDWDFFMTIAGVGSYLSTNRVSEEKHKEILAELVEYDKQGVEVLYNFIGFIGKNTSNETDLSAVVGFWVLWNIRGNPPTHEESSELAPAIGTYIQTVINDLTGEK